MRLDQYRWCHPTTKLIRKIRDHQEYWTSGRSSGWKVLWDWYGWCASSDFNLEVFQEIICLTEEALSEQHHER